MGIFNDEFGQPKTSVLKHLLKTESIETLEQVMMNEDCFIGGYEKAFPTKVAFTYEEFLEEVARREGK